MKTIELWKWRWRMYRLTIKAKILTVIVSIVGIVAFSLLASQYYFSKQLAMKTTAETFTLISKNIREHLREEAKNTKNILNVKSQDRDISEKITFDPMHPSLHGLIQILQIKPNLHAIYFAHPDGSFYEVINMQGRPLLYEVFHAPTETYWTVVTIIDNKEQHAFLDKNCTLIAKEDFSKKYDPRIRPWYKKAQKSKEITFTKPYYFAHSHQMGITYAKVLNGSGIVLAVDYTLSQLNTILAMQESKSTSEIFIVNSQGNKFTSSLYSHDQKAGKAEMLDPELMQKLAEHTIDEIIELTNGQAHSFVIFKPLANKGMYLGIRVNADILLETHRNNLSYSFSIAFLLLLLSLPVIFFSAESMAKPIKDLTRENTKIKERKFSEVDIIDTNIIELEALSESLVSMSQSIQAHEKDQNALLDSIIKLIAEAIDKKSPHTGKH